VKKVYFIVIALLIVMLAAVSCTGSPKSKGDSPAPETPSEVSPPPEMVEDIEDTDEFADIDAEDADGEESDFDDFEEFDLADAEEEAEEEFPAEDELLAEEPAEDEPEPPVVAAVPEPEPPPPPPPAPVTPPPAVTARPSPPPAAPRPAPPPPAATPAPPPPEAPPAAPPPPAEEPPAREPVPRVIPELPNPTPAFRGRPDDEIVFSRTVRATVGQLVVVPFRGTNWIYLGEAGGRRGIAYDSRRDDPEGQSIVFRTEAAGEYTLKFYQQNIVRDFILNDYVKVIVSEPPETAGTGWFNPSLERGRVIAEPRWPTSLEEARALRADTQPSPPRDAAAAPPPAAPAPAPAAPRAQTPPTPPAQQPSAPTPPAQTPPAQQQQPPLVQTPPAVEPVPSQTPAEPPVQIPELKPDEYLQKAQEEFEAGRIATAIAYLDKFREFYPVDSDEVLWLYGQFYEANSPSRNILAALDCYRRLTQEYPQSSRYDAARRRIAYLQRYYINIQ